MSTALDSYRQGEAIRQLELQVHVNELEIKRSKNHRLEIKRDMFLKEKDLQIKELEAATKIKLQKLDIVLQREKNKQFAMENGYDLSSLKTINKKPVTKKKPEIIKL